MFLAACECFFYISAELEFQGVRADHISASEIGFPIFKHGPQIEKHYVVFRLSGREGSRRKAARYFAGTNDSFVPVAGDPVHTLGERVTALVDLGFVCSRPNQTLLFDLCEQSLGLDLPRLTSRLCGRLPIAPRFRDYSPLLHGSKITAFCGGKRPKARSSATVVCDEDSLSQQVLLGGRYYHRAAGVRWHVDFLDA